MPLPPALRVQPFLTLEEVHSVSDSEVREAARWSHENVPDDELPRASDEQLSHFLASYPPKTVAPVRCVCCLSHIPVFVVLSVSYKCRCAQRADAVAVYGRKRAHTTRREAAQT